MPERSRDRPGHRAAFRHFARTHGLHAAAAPTVAQLLQHRGKGRRIGTLQGRQPHGGGIGHLQELSVARRGFTVEPQAARRQLIEQLARGVAAVFKKARVLDHQLLQQRLQTAHGALHGRQQARVSRHETHHALQGVQRGAVVGAHAGCGLLLLGRLQRLHQLLQLGRVVLHGLQRHAAQRSPAFGQRRQHGGCRLAALPGGGLQAACAVHGRRKLPGHGIGGCVGQRQHGRRRRSGRLAVRIHPAWIGQQGRHQAPRQLIFLGLLAKGAIGAALGHGIAIVGRCPPAALPRQVGMAASRLGRRGLYRRQAIGRRLHPLVTQGLGDMAVLGHQQRTQVLAHEAQPAGGGAGVHPGVVDHALQRLHIAVGPQRIAFGLDTVQALDGADQGIELGQRDLHLRRHMLQQALVGQLRLQHGVVQEGEGGEIGGAGHTGRTGHARHRGPGSSAAGLTKAFQQRPPIALEHGRPVAGQQLQRLGDFSAARQAGARLVGLLHGMRRALQQPQDQRLRAANSLHQAGLQRGNRNGWRIHGPKNTGSSPCRRRFEACL